MFLSEIGLYFSFFHFPWQVLLIWSYLLHKVRNIFSFLSFGRVSVRSKWSFPRTYLRVHFFGRKILNYLTLIKDYYRIFIYFLVSFSKSYLPKNLLSNLLVKNYNILICLIAAVLAGVFLFFFPAVYFFFSLDFVEFFY